MIWDPSRDQEVAAKLYKSQTGKPMGPETTAVVSREVLPSGAFRVQVQYGPTPAKPGSRLKGGKK